MKIKTKIISALLVIIILLAVSVTGGFAETIFIVDGYSYTVNTDGTLSLCGWDNSDSTLIIPDKLNEKFVTEVAMYAFQDNDFLTELDFTKATKFNRISTYAFENCDGLSGTLYLPYRILFLGNAAFMNCRNLEMVEFNARTKSVPEQCFRNCASLTKVTIEAGVSEIQANAFRNCPLLNSVTIPKTVTSISSSAFRESPNTVIYCYYDSYAYQYAIENSIPYVLLYSVLLGDADGDGSVNVSDVTKIQRYLAELETLEGIYLRAADANQDGTVDIADATAIQMYLAEYDMEYPIGKVMTQ